MQPVTRILDAVPHVEDRRFLGGCPEIHRVGRDVLPAGCLEGADGTRHVRCRGYQHPSASGLRHRHIEAVDGIFIGVAARGLVDDPRLGHAKLGHNPPCRLGLAPPPMQELSAEAGEDQRAAGMFAMQHKRLGQPIGGPVLLRLVATLGYPA